MHYGTPQRIHCDRGKESTLNVHKRYKLNTVGIQYCHEYSFKISNEEWKLNVVQDIILSFKVHFE